MSHVQPIRVNRGTDELKFTHQVQFLLVIGFDSCGTLVAFGHIDVGGDCLILCQ